MQITKANRKSVIARLNREGHDIPPNTTTRELRAYLDGGTPRPSGKSSGAVTLAEAITRPVDNADEMEELENLVRSAGRKAASRNSGNTYFSAHLLQPEDDGSVEFFVNDSDDPDGYGAFTEITFHLKPGGGIRKIERQVEDDVAPAYVRRLEKYGSELLATPV